MKTAFFLILGIAILFLGYLFLQGTDSPVENTLSTGSNVSLVDGKQVVEIRAKGGYVPRISTAKPGIPTVLQVNTQGTFDCSSVITIPSKGISKNLPPSGVTEIELGSLEPGVLQGACGMGMYPFQIHVQD